MIESARRLGVQEFQGTTDPTQAESWHGRMERVYELIQCIEEKKLRIAAYMLEERALEWWIAICSMQPFRVELTWEDFKKEYNL